LAVILRVATDDQIMLNGRSYWRMNTLLLRDNVVQQNLMKQWKEWRSHQRFYPDKVTWWVRYVKLMLKRHFQREGEERRRERTLENFYYAAIYDTLDASMDPVRKAIMLKRLKAQITNLHYQEGQKIAIQMEESEMMGGRLYPSTNMSVHGRQIQRTIPQIQDADGNIHKKTRDIIRACNYFLEREIFRDSSRH